MSLDLQETGVRAAQGRDLTEEEGRVLSLIRRHGPLTAYQLTRLAKRSVFANFSASKGKIYPIVRRLADAGLVESRAIPGDGRGSRVVQINGAGLAALCGWLDLRSKDAFLAGDPLRDRVETLDLLHRSEQIVWMVDARQRLAEELSHLDRGEAASMWADIANDNAATLYRAQLEWLDRSIARVARASSSGGA